MKAILITSMMEILVVLIEHYEINHVPELITLLAVVDWIHAFAEMTESENDDGGLSIRSFRGFHSCRKASTGLSNAAWRAG